VVTAAGRKATLLVMAALTVVLTACSSGTTTSAPPSSTTAATAVASPATAATTITAKNFNYGAPITVAPGATVTFVNMDDARHNVTADDKSFASPTVNGGTTTFTAPTTPGTYTFHCTFHPTMRGTLIVK
jgi:plastocyanin